MATKAEQFKAEQVRANRPPRAKKKPVRRKLAASVTGLRHDDERPGLRGGPALETSTSGRPSRKSTRKSVGHVKLATNLTRRVTRRTTSSQAKASRASAGRARPRHG